MSMSNPNSYGASGGQNTPWPQYGENAADPAAGYPGAAPAGYPGAASPGYQGAGYGGGPVAVQLPKMPSRAPGVVTLVVGVLLMTLIAPVVCVVTMASGLGGTLEKFAEGANLHNGSTVTVEETGPFTVMISGGQASSCSLKDSTGAEYQLRAYDPTDPSIFTTDMVSAGRYELSCQDVSPRADLLAFPMGVDDMMMALVMPFVWATIVGVLGLVAVIVGIVLIVRVGKKRRMMTQQAMMASIR